MPLSDRLRGQPPFFWLALAVGTALFALYPFAISVLVRAGGREADFGWKVDRDAAGRLAISEVISSGPAEGRLTIGDLLLTINGQPHVARGLGWLLFMDLRPGDRYRVGIEHNAVVANRVVGVDVVVRRGIRYLLAKNVLRVAVFFPLLVVAVSVILNPNRTVTQILFENPFFAGLAIAAALGLLSRERLERGLDRRFFRDAAERDRLLLDLVHELAGRDDLRGVDTLVTGRIERAQHARDVRVLFVEDAQFPTDADALSLDAGATGLAVPIRGGTGRMVGAPRDRRYRRTGAR